ncbi:MAG: prepilin peptidase, partial [Acidimicrobiales bacterium]|nr:prepilin peptidase [Acidimicrobiales bacterium]
VTALVGALMVPVGGVAGAAARRIAGAYGVAAPRWVVEVAGVLVCLPAGLVLGWTWRLGPVTVLLTGLLALSVIDLVLYRLPDPVVGATLVLTGAWMALGELVDGDSDSLARAIIGAGLFSGLLLAIHLVAPAGMGFGDVKLGVVLGLACGWAASDGFEVLRWVFVALFVGSLIGVVFGGALVLLRARGIDPLADPDAGTALAPSRPTGFPFGPALAAGTYIVLLVADRLVA